MEVVVALVVEALASQHSGCLGAAMRLMVQRGFAMGRCVQLSDCKEYFAEVQAPWKEDSLKKAEQAKEYFAQLPPVLGVVATHLRMRDSKSLLRPNGLRAASFSYKEGHST